MQVCGSVSPIRESDVDCAVEVWEYSVRATHHFVCEEDIQIFRPMVHNALKHMIDTACVRDAHGQVAGFVAVADGRVEMLFLHPDVRGQGAGRRLLEHAITKFGATELDVNEQNEQALGFYGRMGFEIIGRSEVDGMGKPYPLLHMRLNDARRE